MALLGQWKWPCAIEAGVFGWGSCGVSGVTVTSTLGGRAAGMASKLDASPGLESKEHSHDNKGHC
jgi:hypothetical protein